MGVSNDAKLVYGVAFDPESRDEREAELTTRVNEGDWDDESWKHGCAVDSEWHCNHDYPMLIVRPGGEDSGPEVICAARGDAVEVTPQMLDAPPEWADVLAKWLEASGFTGKRIGWWLVSMNG